MIVVSDNIYSFQIGGIWNHCRKSRQCISFRYMYRWKDHWNEVEHNCQ